MDKDININMAIENVLSRISCFEVVLFYLRFYKGLKLYDIGRKFGISHETIRKHLKRIAKEIRDEV